MSRIANYASQQSLNSYLLKVQTRLQDSQIKIASKTKALDYMHMGTETQRLVTYEVEVGTLGNFKRSNDIQDVYLSTKNTSMENIDKIVRDFRKKLTSFNTLTPTDSTAIRELQDSAFSTMSFMATFLNDSVGGRYQFSGNRTNTAPVDLGLTTLDAFQTKYDGFSVNYPTTREKHMENFDLTSDSTGQKNWLTFTQDSDGDTTTAGTSTITATTAQFSNVTVGSAIEITGTANNNGTYEVAGVSGGGTILSVKTVMLTDEAATAAPTLTPTEAINPAVAQVDTVTIGGTFGEIGDTYSATVNGTTVTYTTTGAETSLNAIRDGLVSAINTSPTITSQVTVAAGGAGQLTFTATRPGTAQTITVNATNGGATNDNTAVNSITTANVSSSFSSTPMTTANFGTLTFNRAAGTITSATAGALSGLTAGSSFSITGSAQNDGTYYVETAGLSSVTVRQIKLTDEGGTGTETLSTGATNLTLTDNATGNDRITSVAGTEFANIVAGMKVTIGGTAGNDGTYTVVAVGTNGAYIDVLENLAGGSEVAGGDETATVTEADGRIKSANYYQGDDFSHTHRVSTNQDFSIDLNAGNPAFERAIRAMGIIAQGKFGTAGGLEQTANNARITDALNLLDLSLEPNSTTNPQYEAGYTNSLRESITTITDHIIIIDRANKSNQQLSDYLNVQVSSIETINELDVVTALLNDQKSLEASYKAMATIRGLSLVNYL